MDNSLKVCVWEKISGFSSPGEYQRLIEYLKSQVDCGFAKELVCDMNYGSGEVYGGRWFQDVGSGQVWRLVSPDFPFKGLWEPIEN